MQEIQNTAATYSTEEINKKNSLKNEYNTRFESFLTNHTAPEDISYNDYKNLTKEDINRLYPKENKSAENLKALSLHARANASDDEILNKVLFADALDEKSQLNNDKNKMKIDFLIDKWEFINASSMNLDEEIITDTKNQKKITAEGLFKVFENTKRGFEADIENNKYAPSDGVYQKYQNTMAYQEKIKESYLQKVEENDSVLTTYIRRNISYPVDKSIEDNEKFKIIIEDNYISYEEIKNLSYEEMKQLTDAMKDKDEYGNIIKTDKRAAILIGTQAISNNTNFNKAIFNTVNKIEDEKVLDLFMYEVTGTHLSDKLMSNPELQAINYNKQDIKEFVQSQIALYEVKLEGATDAKSKKHYQEILKTYDILNRNFLSLNGESLTKEDNTAEELKALLADIISLFKTGFTVSELEQIEELLAKIKKMIKKRAEGNSIASDEDINKQIKQLEEALIALEKRIKGTVVIEVEEENSTEEKDKNTQSLPDNFNFERRIEVLKEKVNELKKGIQPISIETQKPDKEKLEEDKEW